MKLMAEDIEIKKFFPFYPDLLQMRNDWEKE